MQELQIGTVEIPQDTLDKISQYQFMTGKTFNQVCTEFVVGWMSRSRIYYIESARHNAKIRYISFKEFGETIANDSYDALKPVDTMHVSGKFLEDDSVLKVNFPEENLQTLSLAKIPLGNLNYVLLVSAINNSPLSRRRYISTILYDHINRRWEERFSYQIKMENFSNWES